MILFTTTHFTILPYMSKILQGEKLYGKFLMASLEISLPGGVTQYNIKGTVQLLYNSRAEI